MGSTQHAANEFGCGTPPPRRRWRKLRLIAWAFGFLACLLLLVLGAYETWKWAAVPADAPVIGVSLDTAWHARAGLSTKNYEICLTLVGARILEMGQLVDRQRDDFDIALIRGVLEREQ